MSGQQYPQQYPPQQPQQQMAPPRQTQPYGQAPPNAAGPNVPFRRFQKSYAMTVPGGYQDAGHGCYEGMLACLGSIIGSLGAIPCCLCACFPK
jgi:hypothetical protein